MSLFGGATSQVRAKNLIEFKAGKMNLRGNMVYPDKRKGLLYLYQGNDMLMHLCWKDRSNSSPEDDLVIFPDEIEFKKVTQNTTGRVYILKWKSNARKFFFWMQESKDDKDEEFCKKINDFLNHPPTPGFDDNSNSAHPLQPLMERMAGGAGGLDTNDISNVIRGMNPTDLASLLSTFGRGGSGGAASLLQGLQRSGENTGASASQRLVPSRASTRAQQSASSRPNTAPTSTLTSGTTSTSTSRGSSSSSSSTTAATTAAAAATVPSTATSSTASVGQKNSSIQMSALTNVLANLNNSTTEKTEIASSESSLNVADSETLIPLLSNKDIQEKLRSHLPEGHSISNTEKELRESIQSPEFQQITNAFSTAFRSGELKSILSQLGLSEEVNNAIHQSDFQVFIQALTKHYKKRTNPSDNTMDTN
ncbi:hypothetical protein I4U23_002771 [Adineta vaga]|nr:hypothetical protein I4U23_002771 [Adineta vaga]